MYSGSVQSLGTDYDDFYLKLGLLHKDPIRELIVVPSLMELMKYFCRHTSRSSL